MKIESAAAYRYIKAYAANAGSVNTATTPGKQEAAKTDQLHLSGEVAARERQGRLTQTIAAEISTEVASSRIQELREQVLGGTYHIPSDVLADSILGSMD